MTTDKRRQAIASRLLPITTVSKLVPFYKGKNLIKFERPPASGERLGFSALDPAPVERRQSRPQAAAALRIDAAALLRRPAPCPMAGHRLRGDLRSCTQGRSPHRQPSPLNVDSAKWFPTVPPAARRNRIKQ